MDKKDRINILFIISNIGLGGMEKSLFYLLSNLDRVKYNIHLWSWSSIYKEIQDNISSLDIEPIIWNIDKINSPGTLFKIIPMFREIRKKKIDIIHCFSFDAELLGVPLGFMARVGNILSVRRDMGDWGRTQRHTRIKKFLNRFVTKIITNSENVRSAAILNEGIEEEKAYTIYNGVDFSLHDTVKNNVGLKNNYGIKDNDIVVTLVANLQHRVKGHKYFIQSAKSITERHHNRVKFLIAGNGHEVNLKSELKALVSELNLNDKVVFTGQVKNIIEILSITDIGVNSSLSEGMSNSILEYMAMGKPVVATEVGGNPEVVIDGETGIIVPPKDSQSLAEALLKLINNKELKRSMGSKGKKRAEEYFSAEKMAKEYERMYESLNVKKS